MEEELYTALALRPNISNLDEELVKEILGDNIQIVSEYINLKDGDELPKGCQVIVKDLTIIALNKLGDEGLNSASREGISQNYSSDIPSDILRKLRRFRRLP